MTIESTMHKVKEVISESLYIPMDAVNMNSRLVEDLNADSLDIIEMILSVEREFKVRIPPADAELFKTVGDVFNYLGKLVVE